MTKHPFDLTGKTLIVTGASSGIGRACAVECAKLGATIVAIGRNEARLVETRVACPGEGHRVFPMDVTDDSAVDALVASLTEPVHGVVFAAGVPGVLPIAFATREKVADVMRVNTMAPLTMTQKLVKRNRVAKGGSLVYIASINGPAVVHPGSTPYAMSKTALVGLARSVAFDLAPRGIRANCVMPGMIETPLIHNGALSEEDMAKDRTHYPLRRYGRPEEVAWMVAYLLSDATTWVTGTEFRIDGGFSVA